MQRGLRNSSWSRVRLRKLAMDAKKAPEKPVEAERPKESETREISLPSKQEEERRRAGCLST